MSSQGCGYYWFKAYPTTDWYAEEVLEGAARLRQRNGRARLDAPRHLRRSHSVDMGAVAPAGMYSGYPVPYEGVSKFGVSCPRFWRTEEPHCMVTSHSLPRRWMGIKYNPPVWEARGARKDHEKV